MVKSVAMMEAMKGLRKPNFSEEKWGGGGI